MNNTADCVALKLQSNQFQFAKDPVSHEREGINVLPGEILYKIFSDLPLQSLASVNSASKRWNKIENNRLIRLIFLSCIEGKKVFIKLLNEFETYFNMFFPENIEQLTEFLNEPANEILVKMLLEVFMENNPQTKVSDILNIVKHYNKENCQKLIPFLGYLTGIQSMKTGIITAAEIKLWLKEIKEGMKYLEIYRKEDSTGVNHYLATSLIEYMDSIARVINKDKLIIYGLQRSAEKGFKDAYWKLGDVYWFKENSSEEDKIKAYEHYKKAADLQCLAALRRLIYMGINKEIVVPNEELCTYFISVAKFGNSTDIFNLSILYFMGIMGFKRDIEKGLYYIEEAVKANNVYAANCMCSYHAQGLYFEKNYEKATKYFNIVKNGSLLPSGKFNPQFANQLAELFENGYGVKKDMNLAKNYYELSAKDGDKESLYILGNYIEEGVFGFDKDQMMNYYKESADKGHVASQFKMCQIYSEGLYDIPKDSSKAIHYFNLLNNTHNIQNEGIQNGKIALCYMHGFGVKKDFKTAYEYYHKASDEFSHANSQFKLCIYYNQQNDFLKSQHYFNLLSDKYHPENLIRINERYRNISYCYAKGIGTTKDEEKAALYKQMEIDTGARFLTTSWL